MTKEKLIKHPTTEELVDINSKYSSMRWAFLFMVKIGAILAIVSLGGMLVASLLGKKFPEAGAASIVGLVLTTAFGGKALQTGVEKPSPIIEEVIEEIADPNSFTK